MQATCGIRPPHTQTFTGVWEKRAGVEKIVGQDRLSRRGMTYWMGTAEVRSQQAAIWGEILAMLF